MEFSTFIPFFGNKNPFVRYFVKLDNGKKKELKEYNLRNNLYYFCVNRKRIFVEVSGGLWHKNFKVLKNYKEV